MYIFIYIYIYIFEKLYFINLSLLSIHFCRPLDILDLSKNGEILWED